MKILISDDNHEFLEDIEVALLDPKYSDLDIETNKHMSKMFDILQENDYDIAVIPAAYAEDFESEDLNCRVICFGHQSSDIPMMTGHDSYGVCRMSDDLLNAIINNKTLNMKTEEKQTESPQKKAFEKPQNTAFKTNSSDDIDLDEFLDEPKTNPVPNKQPQPQSKPAQKTPPVSFKPSEPSDDDFDIFEEDYLYEERPETTRETKQVKAAESDSSDIKRRLREAREEERKRQEEQERLLEEKRMRQAAQAVEKDLGNVRSATKVVTICSTKGGVGKTTIAAELATYLSLMSDGRKRLNVCVVDFNIDFGDVCSTLGFDPEGSCMTEWAKDIKERLNRLPVDETGTHTPEQIASVVYKKERMGLFLQHKEDSGLYALLAPISNEDSMDIEEEEVAVMINNLINVGDFDYIIIDTGNNTRETTMMALEEADVVLMVLTQDINTANCNVGILNTLEKIQFDLDKFRLIINRVEPAKVTGLPVAELEEAFAGYQVVGRIRELNEVKIARNNQKAVVFNSSSDFTKNMGAIAAFIIGEHYEIPEPEKQGLFKKLFGRKK